MTMNSQHNTDLNDPSTLLPPLNPRRANMHNEDPQNNESTSNQESISDTVSLGLIVREREELDADIKNILNNVAEIVSCESASTIKDVNNILVKDSGKADDDTLFSRIRQPDNTPVLHPALEVSTFPWPGGDPPTSENTLLKNHKNRPTTSASLKARFYKKKSLKRPRMFVSADPPMIDIPRKRIRGNIELNGLHFLDDLFPVKRHKDYTSKSSQYRNPPLNSLPEIQIHSPTPHHPLRRQRSMSLINPTGVSNFDNYTSRPPRRDEDIVQVSPAGVPEIFKIHYDPEWRNNRKNRITQPAFFS